MAGNSDIKQHVSIAERDKWDNCVERLNAHIGAGGTVHAIATGSIAGFSINNYTTEEKNKLAGIQAGALNNPHPATHPYTMITGLSTVGHTGSYRDLLNIPLTFIAGGGNSDTVGGIRFTVGATAPSSPKNNKDVWFDTSNRYIKVYTGGSWVIFGAVFT